MALSDVTQNPTFSISHPTPCQQVRGVFKTDTASSGYRTHWRPLYGAPRERASHRYRGTVAPYLDDYEPNERSIAALAVASVRPDVIEQRLGVVTCGGRDDAQSGWDEPRTVVGTAKPTRTPLHPQGCEHILELIGRAEMVKFGAPRRCWRWRLHWFDLQGPSIRPPQDEEMPRNN